MSSEKIRAMERYYETVPYGNKSLSSEIHGPKNQANINAVVKNLVMMSDVAMQQGNTELAETFKSAIYKISKELDTVKMIKEEHAMDLRTRSNWTDHGWDDNFMTENGEIFVDENMNVILRALDPTTGEMVDKKPNIITKDWESIGDWMQTLMQAKQDLIKARGDLNTPPPFDIDFFVNNLIKDNWRSILSDPDPTLDPNDYHNGYRLQQILHLAADANGNIPVDYNLDKNSFDPTYDTRIHEVIANDLKTAFDPNYQSNKDIAKARELMARINT
tara:strand:- start:11102 stop:11926 length:825 start_codon:yes stop_codon:yes gene_type:complete